MAKFSSSTVLKCSVVSLRQYLGKTSNLPSISDPELQLKVLDAPDEVTVDAVIEFQISAYGFKQTITHRYISVSETEIVAEQIEGPTRTWTHRQTITDNDDGTCALTDDIEFEPPGGMLGYVMTESKICESIQEGMDFRYESLEEILEPPQ